MRNKRLLEFVLIFLLLFSVLGIIFQQSDIQNLELQVSERDSLISKTQKGDSIYAAKYQTYYDTIIKYLDRESNFYIDDKKISIDQLLSLVNSSFDKIDTLEAALILCKVQSELSRIQMTNDSKTFNDSIFILNRTLELVKKYYGVEYTIEKSGNATYYIRNFSTADSALILFPYYKDRLSSKDGTTWIIIRDNKSPVEFQNKKSRWRDRIR